MNSQFNFKGTARRLALISAVFLLQSNTLLAAEYAADPQLQARDLLTGTARNRSTADESPAVPIDGDAAPVVDAQEQARRMILGTPTRGTIDSPVAAETSKELRAESETGRHRYVDPQELAQRMILGPGATAASKGSASLTQIPLVIRLSKDEFRIAFGINAEPCKTLGCNGIISYRIDWKAEDGSSRSEHKRLDYTAVPGAGRTIAVDRQIFDTAEGKHTTQVVRVNVDDISRIDGPAPIRGVRASNGNDMRLTSRAGEEVLR